MADCSKDTPSTAQFNQKLHIITIEEFREYANYYAENSDNMVFLIIKSAEKIVQNYLGFYVYPGLRKEIFTGDGNEKYFLSNRFVEQIYFLEINGDIINPDRYILNKEDDSVEFIDGSGFPIGKHNCHIEYECGLRKQDVPAPIKMAALRIAALQLAESNGNIGLTGKTFADQSRSFINYSNYQKYLQPITEWKTRWFK